MRGIKFRAWDKEFKRFSEKALNHTIADINFHTDYEWMQYTGLIDKHNVEIYVGDILKVTPNNLKHYPVSNFVVHESRSAWGVEYSWQCVKGYECSTHLMDFDCENNKHLNVEIIGNIYENPELLEETA